LVWEAKQDIGPDLLRRESGLKQVVDPCVPLLGIEFMVKAVLEVSTLQSQADSGKPGLVKCPTDLGAQGLDM
jgi:hypothetical protein